MSTTESTKANIGAAFEVVRQTYFNLEKFFKELDDAARKAGYSSLVQSKPGFLRWKSDDNPWGWMVSNFIKLYQWTGNEEPMGETPDQNVRIYGVEIDFLSTDGPVVRIIRYEYDTNKTLDSNVAVSKHWLFYFPMRREQDFTIHETHSFTVASTSETKSAAIDKYFGLRKTTWRTRELVGITQGNVVDLVREFDRSW